MENGYSIALLRRGWNNSIGAIDDNKSKCCDIFSDESNQHLTSVTFLVIWPIHSGEGQSRRTERKGHTFDGVVGNLLTLEATYKLGNNKGSRLS